MIEWKYDRNGTAHATWAWPVKSKRLGPVENRWVFVEKSGSAATQAEATQATEAALAEG
jgi:hypothetical protein